MPLSVVWKGCEKFVLKFPQQVLGSFIDSFAVVPAPGKNWKKRQLRIQIRELFFELGRLKRLAAVFHHPQ